MSEKDAPKRRIRLDRLSELRKRTQTWRMWPYRICRDRHRVVLIRHAEPSSTGSDPGLSPAGRARAVELVHVLGDTEVRKIIVSHLKRTQQTAADLATHLGLTPVVVNATDTAAIMAEVDGASGRVLVVGHSNTVPELIEQLGGDAMDDLEHDEFDNLFVVQHGKVMHLRTSVPA